MKKVTDNLKMNKPRVGNITNSPIAIRGTQLFNYTHTATKNEVNFHLPNFIDVPRRVSRVLRAALRETAP